MKRIINYFDLRAPYEFDWNDIFCLLNYLNVFAVIHFGLVASWFGLAITLVFIFYDILIIKRLNILFLHFSIIILNTHFLLMYYGI